MARVFVDPHMFSESWFKAVLPELVKCPKVVFVFGLSEKHLEERGRVRQALEFYKIVGYLRSPDGEGRRVDVLKSDLDEHEDFLNGTKCFVDCDDCDAPHIFALVFVKPTPYIFSMDARMAKCRGVINKNVDKKYCQFIIVSKDKIYKDHRPAIMS